MVKVDPEKSSCQSGGHEPPTVAEDGATEILSDAVHTDVGWGLYQKALSLEQDEREEISEAVKRKLDFILLPMVCIFSHLAVTR